MVLGRRPLARVLLITAFTTLCVAAYAGVTLAAPSLWECNWCHQQYQGTSPPAFAKCPAKEMKQNHWWIKKG